MLFAKPKPITVTWYINIVLAAHGQKHLRRDMPRSAHNRLQYLRAVRLCYGMDVHKGHLPFGKAVICIKQAWRMIG